jgi:hypothetical protein
MIYEWGMPLLGWMRERKRWLGPWGWIWWRRQRMNPGGTQLCPNVLFPRVWMPNPAFSDVNFCL